MGSSNFSSEFQRKGDKASNWGPRLDSQPREVHSTVMNVNPKCQWGFQDVRDASNIWCLLRRAAGTVWKQLERLYMCFHMTTPGMEVWILRCTWVPILLPWLPHSRSEAVGCDPCFIRFHYCLVWTILSLFLLLVLGIGVFTPYHCTLEMCNLYWLYQESQKETLIFWVV